MGLGVGIRLTALIDLRFLSWKFWPLELPRTAAFGAGFSAAFCLHVVKVVYQDIGKSIFLIMLNDILRC